MLDDNEFCSNSERVILRYCTFIRVACTPLGIVTPIIAPIFFLCEHLIPKEIMLGPQTGGSVGKSWTCGFIFPD